MSGKVQVLDRNAYSRRYQTPGVPRKAGGLLSKNQICSCPNVASMHAIIYAIDVPNKVLATETPIQPSYEWLRHSEFMQRRLILARLQLAFRNRPFYIVRLQSFADICRSMQYYSSNSGHFYCFSTMYERSSGLGLSNFYGTKTTCGSSDLANMKEQRRIIAVSHTPSFF